MNEHNVDPDKIIKKVTNTPVMSIFALIVSLFFLGLFIFGFFSYSNDKVLGTVFMIMGIILFITFYLIYYFHKRKVKKNIKNISLDRVKREIMEGVVSDNSSKTYFTNSYILSNYYYGFIIEYKDILWIYKRTLYDPNTLLPRYDLVICPKDGKKYYTDYKDMFVDEIVKHNNSILIGNNPDNKNKYNELINRYKN